MDTLHINSHHFICLAQQGDNSDYPSERYHFDALHSGISLHGERITVEQDLHYSRLTDAYVNLIIPLEGRLDPDTNHKRYCIRTDGGRMVLVTVDEEILFSCYPRCGGTTVKIALKDIEH